MPWQYCRQPKAEINRTKKPGRRPAQLAGPGRGPAQKNRLLFNDLLFFFAKLFPKPETTSGVLYVRRQLVWRAALSSVVED